MRWLPQPPTLREAFAIFENDKTPETAAQLLEAVRFELDVSNRSTENENRALVEVAQWLVTPHPERPG